LTRSPLPQGNLKCFASSSGPAAAEPADAPPPLLADPQIEWEERWRQQQQLEGFSELACSAHQTPELGQLRALLLVRAGS
jgi:hypothetical protein